MFLKPLNELENVIGCDDVSIKESGKVIGRNIANGFFHSKAGHPFLSKLTIIEFCFRLVNISFQNLVLKTLQTLSMVVGQVEDQNYSNMFTTRYVPNSQKFVLM